MKVWTLTLLAASVALAGDTQQMALSLKAQSDYDRVTLEALPSLRETTECVQSQAALLPLAAPSDAAAIQYRRGYCVLAGATLSRDPNEFAAAASAFDKAIAAWPARIKDRAPEPVSSGLQVLAAIARLQAGDTARGRQDLSQALQAPTCLSNLMTRNRCEAIIDLGRQWMGYLALQDGDLSTAGQNFQPATAPAWGAWTFAKEAFRSHSYDQAAADYLKAVDLWNAKRDTAELPVVERLAPQPDMAEAYTELGGAQLLAGNAGAAIASLTQAIKEDPTAARPLYLRARAKEATRDLPGALADYNLASRTAFASAKDLASGEAHLYRGILLYRRKQYNRAEDEFSSALNFEIPKGLRHDAEAWRHMAAVAGGSCDVSRQLLAGSLQGVSPFFPQSDAQAVMAACRTAQTAARVTAAAEK